MPHFLIYQVQCIWVWDFYSTWTWALCRVIIKIYLLPPTCQHPVWPALIFIDAVFLPVYISGLFIKKSNFISMWIYVWIFKSIPLINVSILGVVDLIFYYYRSVVQLEIGASYTSHGSFSIQNCFSYSGFFIFLYEPENYPFKICEEVFGILKGLHWIYRALLVGWPYFFKFFLGWPLLLC